MVRELAEMVKKMPKLDWTQRESVRADLRRKVRRLLAMYGYPSELSEDATQLVLKQAVRRSRHDWLSHGTRDRSCHPRRPSNQRPRRLDNW